ncbi:MAG: PH domain-containing protein [Actinomycetaceae bacterium]|nr:PH domain-containing protein [Actinomycetaceae bacterium]
MTVEATPSAPSVEWRRVHPVTPLTRTWSFFAILGAIGIQQMLNNISGALEFLGKASIRHYFVFVLLFLLAFLAIVVVYCFLAWRVTGFAISDESVMFREGILFRKQRDLRLDRVQAVDITTPLLGRLFGLGKLRVDSAGGSDSQVDIAYLPSARLIELRAEILAKAAGVKFASGGLEASGGSNIAEGGPVAGPNVEVPVAPTDHNAAHVGSYPGEGILPSAALGLGFSGEGALTEAPERTMYEVTTPVLIASLLRSLGLWVAVLVPLSFLMGTLGVMVWVSIEKDISFIAVATTGFGALIGAMSAFAGSVSYAWSVINGGFGFTAAVSPDGIRLRHGLTEHKSQTLPPGRVHAVQLVQPFLWRRKDWWKVTITVAGYGMDKDSVKSTTLLPVGTRADALRALWLVERDFGVVLDLDGREVLGADGSAVDPATVLNEGLYGTGESVGFYCVPGSAKWLDWISWRRKAVAVTSTMLWIRHGRITRRVSFVPHARAQSVGLHQGPLERALGLANVWLHLVPGLVDTRVTHLRPEQALKLWKVQAQRARFSREAEGPEQWMTRVTQHDALPATSSPGDVVEETFV